MPDFFNEGSVDKNAVFLGEWQEVAGIVSGTRYQIGTCKAGELIFGRTMYRHEDTSFPKKVDLVINVSVSITFSGQVDEVNKQNVAIVMGLSPATSTEFIYFGNLVAPSYYGFHLLRRRQSDGQFIEGYIYKAITTGQFNLGASDEAVSIPLELEGMDDDDGSYGSTAQGRLGYLRIPAKT